MTSLALRLRTNGFHLRSGGAIGADSAFAKGHILDNMTIYRPDHAICDKAAEAMFRSVHPYQYRFKKTQSILLHSRNAYQVLGFNLNDPVDFVLCWTSLGSESEAELKSHGWVEGGTATAIAIASRNGVPVFNLQKEDCLNRFYRFMKNKYDLG
jgi:hypothetical protein